uniref:Transmembrane protein 117 n=1 Tax=Rhodnius prolixus TaxID=13249 RepID=T1ICX7_RHOPR
MGDRESELDERVSVSSNSKSVTNGREIRALNRNASFDLAQRHGGPKKTHVRTGSDFWTQAAEQASYIDSTRSSLVVDSELNTHLPKKRVGYAGSNSTPSLVIPLRPSSSLHHQFSVREQRRNLKVTRFYSHDHDNILERGGELRVLQPLLTKGGGSRTSLAAIWAAVDNNNQTKINRKLNAVRKPSSWEESVSLQRRRSLAVRNGAKGDNANIAGSESCYREQNIPLPITTLAGLDTKDLRYCFQHPYLRLFTTLLVIFCNFLLFAEDPISHSHTESVIPMVGNVFSFVCTKYPPDWRWALIKVLMWILAIFCGLVMGKLFIHSIVFGKYLRLKMFRDEQGSWIAMFLTVILSLVMKAAACGTWLGDLVTWLMVTDVMLQDSLYPDWAPALRRLWRKSNIPRILIFWVGSALGSAFVVTLIVGDLISWDTLNQDFVASTELSRAFLASFILVLDLVIMMQDWDFPHFTTTVHINLPGFSVATLEWKYAEVNLTGKWFSYGVIFMVMLLDLNMWKNQIFYTPDKFGQYIDDMKMNSRYMGYPLLVKCTAFLPSMITLSFFLWLIYLYGRFPHKEKIAADSATAANDIESEEGGITAKNLIIASYYFYKDFAEAD